MNKLLYYNYIHKIVIKQFPQQDDKLSPYQRELIVVFGLYILNVAGPFVPLTISSFAFASECLRFSIAGNRKGHIGLAFTIFA